MNEDFFEWLNKCPTQWCLLKAKDGECRDYCFHDNEKDCCDEEEEE